MDTPICDFVRNYAQSNVLRLHMPGHKGDGPLGIESLDITEIKGADALYEADGIIAQSEANASRLFGTPTFYSTEGSSQCIRAMLYLICVYAAEQGRRPLIAAGRNAHKAFVSAAALLEFDVMWLYPEQGGSYLSCGITGPELEKVLRNAEELPTAVYVTSPDYLGNMLDVRELSEVCQRYGVLLLVDNAHGAYLKFLPESQHPVDLGADLCCDSAHKTLPVLTGGAYLHISHSAPGVLAERAKQAMVLFGSTSPSYLILQSLDAANRYLEEKYTGVLKEFLPKVKKTKETLSKYGYTLVENEVLKATIAVKQFGYTGIELSEVLREKSIECEFADPDYLVLMLAPELGAAGLQRLENALLSVPRRPAIEEAPPVCIAPERTMSIRDAVFSRAEFVPVAESLGRVLATASVGCPPAVPIVVSGEVIDEAALKCFEYYGIDTCSVVKR